MTISQLIQKQKISFQNVSGNTPYMDIKVEREHGCSWVKLEKHILHPLWKKKANLYRNQKVSSQILYGLYGPQRLRENINVHGWRLENIFHPLWQKKTTIPPTWKVRVVCIFNTHIHRAEQPCHVLPCLKKTKSHDYFPNTKKPKNIFSKLVYHMP